MPGTDNATESPRAPGTSSTLRRSGALPHAVRFYENDDLLGVTVAHFVAEGLRQGDPTVVIASQQHWDIFGEQLRLLRVDVQRALKTGNLVYLDARQTLVQLMEGSVPDRARFLRIIGGAVERLTGGASARPFRAYGEMVDLLCEDGNVAGALRLENYWDDLASRYSFSLLCGYGTRHFQRAECQAIYEQVAAAHTHVIGNGDQLFPEHDAARCEIDRLRQRVRSLEVEVEYRLQLENELVQSKRELADFLEEGAEGIHRVADDGTILWANKAELHLLGYTANEYLGHHIAEFHVDGKVIGDILARLSRGETLHDYEARMRCKDGSVRTVMINSNVFRENGKFVHTRCFTRDITERKKAEGALRFLVEAGDVIASSLDYEQTLSTVCRMCVPRLADWAAIDLKIDGSIKRVAVEHTDPAKTALVHRLSQRLPVRLDAAHGVGRVIRTGETEVLAELDESILIEAIPDPELLDAVRKLGLRSSLCVPLTSGDETIGAITLVSAESWRKFGARDVVLIEDLARRASAAIVHARLFRDAQAATRMKDEFLATVSHELRTPLNAILGWARMLRTGNLAPDKVSQGLEAIERNSIAQRQLVEDLLDVSRIISGKLRLDVQPIALATCVEAAIESVQQAIQAKNIQFQTVIDPNAGPIAGDPHRMQQVIWNLVTNAVKFTPKGGTVRVIVERAESSIALIVSDTGQGIATHLLQSIFERFKQADGGTARVHGGLGLGLAIVRHIVELHGGSVQALSDGVGRGATFIVRLPVTPLRVDMVGPFRHPAQVGVSPKFDTPKELQGLTVLVVDDEADTRDMLSEVLEQCGCSVLTASSAQEGLAVLDRASPRVLVSDIGMPEMDGYGFIEMVRRRPPNQGGRVVAVALTAYAGAEDRRRALRAGYQMHMAKPVEPAEFVAVLANVAQLAITMS